MADETQPETLPNPSVSPQTPPAPETVPTVPEPDPAATPESLVQDFKKDELVAAAAVQGVDVPSSATKAVIAEAIVQNQSAAKPVLVNQFTRRSDNDALLGSWVDIVAGEYEGRRGSYQDDATHDPQTGYPQTVMVRTRDAENELIVVNYSDIRPSAYTGGR